MSQDAKVTVDCGRVWVDGTLIAGTSRRWSLGCEREIERVRERTPVAWWRRAAEIEACTADLGTGGPVGEGVDFLGDDLDVALPPEVREVIQNDAYEAAREVIVRGIEDHARRMARAVTALSVSLPESPPKGP